MARIRGYYIKALEAHFCTILRTFVLGSALPRTGSPRPFGPGTPEESEESPERAALDGTPRIPKECSPESQKSPKRVRESGLDSFRTLLRLQGALFRHSGGAF